MSQKSALVERVVTSVHFSGKAACDVTTGWKLKQLYKVPVKKEKAILLKRVKVVKWNRSAVLSVTS